MQEKDKEELYNYTYNRELSWLGFNERVLREALDDNNPAYEKLKFIAIFNSNLDEFFNVRVGSLNDLSLLKDPPADNKTGLSPDEQLDLIYKRTGELLKENEDLYKKVMKDLGEKGIHSYKYADLSEKHKAYVDKIYTDQIEPILAPQIINSFHPFPFIENKNIYIICELDDDGEYSLGLLPIPYALPDFYMLSDKEWIRTESILKAKVDKVFSFYKVKKSYIMNLHRNMDLNYEDHREDEAIDYKMQMKKLLKKRTRLQVLRVNTDSPLEKTTQEFLKDRLNIKDHQFFTYTSPFNMGYVFKLENNLKSVCDPNLFYDSFSPKLGQMIDPNKSMFEQIEERDRLLIYPYEDIDSFLKLLEEAAENPDVISIKITIYRLAKNSKVVKNLLKARENGKEVTVILELRARFDEESNINYSQTLYDEGCTILYGTEDYKVHSKVCLITYKDASGNIKYISQIGTGNYNESTSKQYADISLMTAHPGIGKDCNNFFNHINLENVNHVYENILAAPYTLKSSILEKMEREIKKGKDGKLFLKCNSVTDKEIIKKLSEASQAGVDVRMIVRGISCIRPQVEGYTDNIEIKSIVGRYLEHARVYIFGDNEEIYIGSADLMTRNLIRRVEVIIPIYDPAIKEKIIEYMNIQWLDNTKGQMINSQGQYEKISVTPGEDLINSQEAMMELAKNRQPKADPNSKKNKKVKAEKKEKWLDKIRQLFKK